MKMRFADCGSVRAVMEGERRILEVLAIPYGGPDRPDRLGQWFTPQTEIMLKVGDHRPVLYMHGRSPQGRMMSKPPVLGDAEFIREDAAGKWMRVEIDQTDLSTRSWQAAIEGRAAASTGAIGYLVQPEYDEKAGKYPPGPVEMWAVGELSVFDRGDHRIPVSDDAVVLPIRAIFNERGLHFPEAFEADEAEEAEEAAEPIIDHVEGDEPMTEKVEVTPVADPAAEREALKASIIAELKGDPKYRAVFNVAKETVGTRGLPAEKQESHEWFWQMRHGIGPSMRVLEETEAAEGLPMVPQDALNAIISQRNETSLASRAGLTRYTTDKLIWNLPRENTAMTALAAIAEEGAYVANEPAFALAPYTVVKYGSMLTATEELLEDQALFQAWLPSAIGRAWALAENAALYTAADVAGNGTVGVAVESDTLTLAEFNEFFWTMTTPYRDNCVLVMHTATMSVLYALQLAAATPYAFGGYPDQERTPLGIPSINGLPVHLCNNWLAYNLAADLQCVLSMINREFAGIIERRGMKLFVDPYGDSVNGRIRYFPSVRFVPFFSQPLAHVVKNGNT